MYDGRSEGHRASKPSKIIPKLRGEIWETNFRGRVTVLVRLRGGVVEVTNSAGKTEVLWDSQFKRRVFPPIVEA